MKKNNNIPLLVAVTGDIGSGKSAVVTYFQKNNYHVFSADQINHDLLEEKNIIETLTNEFGEGIITDGKVNRVVLRNLVFKNRVKLDFLNNFMHPKIIEKLFNEINNCEDPQKKKSAIIVEVPLLFESNLETKFNLNILVVANDNIKKQRIGNRSDIPAAFIDIIMKHQMPQELKMQRADLIINNNLDENFLLGQIKIIEQMIDFMVKKESIANLNEV